MSEGAMGLLVFIFTALVSSLIWHRYVAAYSSAVFGATLSAVMLFQVFAYLQLGYLAPFFLIAVATSSVMAVIIALLVGLPFRARRKADATKNNAL